MTSRSPARKLVFLGVGAVLLAAGVYLYGHIVFYGLTSWDAPYIILSAQIDSLSDVATILTSPFMERASLSYFRPATTLTFSLVHALFGLNPMGYHLMNLTSHLTVGLLAAFFVHRLEGSPLHALLTGLLFLLYPLHVHIVPAISLGQDIYVTLFFLACLVCFLLYRQRRDPRLAPTYLLALTFFLLSVGAKEVGYLLVPILVVLWWVMERRQHDRMGPRRFVRQMAPFLAVGFLFFLHWAWVTDLRPFLSGSGPWRGPILADGTYTMLVRLVQRLASKGTFYLAAVFEPVRLTLEFAGVHTPSIDFLTGQLGTVLVSVFVGLLFVLNGASARPGSGRRAWHFPGVPALLGLTVIGALAVLLVISLVLLSYGLPLPLVDGMISSAHHGNGPGFLEAMMESRHQIELQQYLTRAHVFLVLLLSAGLTGGILVYGLLRRELGLDRTAVLYLAWFLLPILFYSFTNIVHLRNAYLGLPAVCALASKFLTGCLPAFPTGSLDPEEPRPPRSSSGSLLRAGPTVLAVLLAVTVFISSPLVTDYPSWNRIQSRHDRFLAELSRTLRKLPPKSEVTLSRPPKWDPLATDQTRLPNFSGGAHAVPRLSPWIRLHFPDRAFRVRVEKPFRYLEPDCECRFSVVRKTLASHVFYLDLQVDP